MDIHRRGKIESAYSFQVTFDGGLQSNVRAQIINELIKYILYERQQIPLTFDQIKRDVDHESRLQKQKEADHTRRKMNVQRRMQIKKTTDVVNKLDNTFSNIFNAFDASPEILKAAIVIGATPVSPKEVYLIELPPLSPDADNLPAKLCVKSLFKQLIMLDPLCRVDQIHPTNTAVLLYAPRCIQIPWFYPKPLFKIPVRGKHFNIQLNSSCGYGNHNLSKNFSVVDLSGFGPLDSSVEDISMVSDIAEEENTSTSSESLLTAEYVCVDSDQDYDVIESVDNSGGTTPVNIQDKEVDCSKISTASSTSSSKSCVTASAILSRTSAFTACLSCSNTDNPVSNTEHSDVVAGVDSDDNSDLLIPDSSQEYIWFQSPVFIKGYRDKFP